MNPELDQDGGPALSDFVRLTSDSQQAERDRMEKLGPYRGPLPIGYRRVKRAFGWEILPDEHDASYVRLAFLLAARPGTSVVKVREEVTCWGLRNHRGVPLCADKLRLMLADPFYAGLRQTDEGLVPGGWQPLVDAATFAAVQRNLAERRRGPRERVARRRTRRAGRSPGWRDIPAFALQTLRQEVGQEVPLREDVVGEARALSKEIQIRLLDGN